MPLTRTIEESFWSKTDKRGPDECWPWLGAKNHKGYGYIGRNGDGQRYFKATRVSWSIANGVPFPADLYACHTCDNPSCVNPAHIWPGTPRENMYDRIRKGCGIRVADGKCVHGHLLAGENAIHRSNGRVRCRTCIRDRGRSKNLAIKALRAVSSIRPSNWNDGDDPEQQAAWEMVDRALHIIAKREQPSDAVAELAQAA